MAKRNLASRFLRLSTFLRSLLVLVFLTSGLVYADSGWNGDNIDVIVKHVEEVRDKDPQIDKKFKKLQEKLEAGISSMEACQYCHTSHKKSAHK